MVPLCTHKTERRHPERKRQQLFYKRQDDQLIISFIAEAEPFCSNDTESMQEMGFFQPRP